MNKTSSIVNFVSERKEIIDFRDSATPLTLSRLGEDMSLEVVNSINLDIRKKTNEIISAIQFDKGARKIRISLTDNGVPLKLATSRVYLYCLKSDGNKVFNEAEILLSNTGIVLITLTEQMLSVKGKQECVLVIREGEKQLTTFSFFINVEDSIYDDNYIESTDEFKAFDLAMQKVNDFDNQTNALKEYIGQKVEGILYYEDYSDEYIEI